MGLGDTSGSKTLGILTILGLGALLISSVLAGSDKPLFSGLGRAPARRRRSKTSPAARKYINKKIEILVHEEGYPQKQAVAVAYSMARKRGYKVPKRPRRKKK